MGRIGSAITPLPPEQARVILIALALTVATGAVLCAVRLLRRRLPRIDQAPQNLAKTASAPARPVPAGQQRR